LADQEKASYRWPMLSYLFFTNLTMNGFVINVMPPLFPHIAAELGLSYAQIGVILGALPFGMLLFSLPGGVVADRLGVKKVVGTAVICAAVVASLRGFASSFGTMVFCMFLLGIAEGFLIPNLTKGIAMWFEPEELSRANGILLMGAGIGAGLTIALAVPLYTAVGSWQNVMFLTGVVSLLIWVLWLFAVRERQYTGLMAELMKRRPGPLEGLRRVLAVKDTWLLCITELFAIGGIVAMVGFLPIYLVAKGMTAQQAGVLTSLSIFTSLVGMYVGPYISDKVGLRKPLVWPFFLVVAVLRISLPFLWGWPLYMVWCVIGFCDGCALPQLRSMIIELKEIGPILAGSAFGCIFTFNRIGGFIMPWLMGSVMTVIRPLAGFYLCSGLAIIAAIFVAMARETGRRAQNALASSR